MALLKTCCIDKCSRDSGVMYCAVSAAKHRTAVYFLGLFSITGSSTYAECRFCCLLGRKEHAD
jgi:hypothetical protein